MMQDDNFNHERAADRFAAAILQIADLSEVPYVAVVRRLIELGETVPGKKLTEMEWLFKRNEIGFPVSILDQSSMDTRFVAYETAVKENIDNKGLDIYPSRGDENVLTDDKYAIYDSYLSDMRQAFIDLDNKKIKENRQDGIWEHALTIRS